MCGSQHIIHHTLGFWQVRRQWAILFIYFCPIPIRPLRPQRLRLSLGSGSVSPRATGHTGLPHAHVTHRRAIATINSDEKAVWGQIRAMFVICPSGRLYETTLM